MAQNVNAAELVAIGQQIRQLRQVRDLSRARAAQALHVDPSSISGWENGRRLPRLDMRLKLAKLLNVNILFPFPSQRHTVLPHAVRLIDTHADLPDIMLRLTKSAAKCLRALLLAGHCHGNPAWVWLRPLRRGRLTA